MKLPHLRTDLALEDDGRHLTITDPVDDRRLGLAGLGAAIVRSLAEGTDTLADLLDALGNSPTTSLLEIHRRLVFLDEQHLFRARPEGPGPTTVEGHAEGVVIVPPKPLSAACIGCGMCCRHTYVAPFTREEVARIEGLYPEREDVVFQVFDEESGGSVLMSDGRTEQCPFLLDDDRCELQRDHGYEAKGMCCRQFPVTLTEVGGVVYGSLSMECSEYHRVRESGETLASMVDELTAMARQGYTVYRVAEAAMLDPHTVLEEAVYDELEGALLTTIDGWEGDLGGLLVDLRDTVAAVSGTHPILPDAAAWESFATARGARMDDRAVFAHRLGSFYTDGGMLIHREIEAERSRWRVQDLQLLGVAMDGLYGGPGPLPDDEEVLACAKDFLYAKIAGKYLRRRPHVAHCFAVLVLTVLLTSASMEPEVPVGPEIWVDRCVRLTKIQRDTAWLRFLLPRSNDLRYLVLDHVEAFV